METISTIFVSVMIVTTLPFVASILASINPKLRVESALSYFLSNRKLEIDGFIATTIGYSLQVASIYLFLYWTFLYGIYPIIVCIAWTLGYWILSELLRRGKLDGFLGTGQIQGNKASQQTTAITTIHGFVGRRFGSPISRSGRMAVLTLALASTIGLGGTMITEIDYSASFFLQSIGASDTSEMLLVVIHVSILLFTVMYVLWGGFRAVCSQTSFRFRLRI
jgi:hypothetical protein